MLKIVKKLPAVQVVLAVLFLLVQAVCVLSLPTLMSDMVNGGIVAGSYGMIMNTGLIMLILTGASLVGALLNTYISAKISYKMGTELRREMFAHVLKFSKVDYDKLGTSSLITRCTNDVTQVQTLVEMGLKFLILCPVYLAGAIFFTYRLNHSYAYIFLMILPVLSIAAVVIYKTASPLYEKIQSLLDRLNLLFREGLSGVKIIRAFNKEAYEMKKYKEVNEEYKRKAITAGTIMNMLIPFITLIVNFTTILILWIGSKQMNAGGGNIGAIMGAVSYSAQILTGFGILTMVILAIPKGQVSAKRIYEVLDLEPELEENDSEDEIIFNGISKDLTLKHVGFSYNGAETRALKDVGFTIQSGQQMAVLGSTGSGKTTLTNILLRNYEADSGEVLLYGENIKDISLKELRNKISICPQKNSLFMGSIRENLKKGNEEAEDEEIWEALRIACADEFVKKLGSGLDSKVEKNGGNLSGGQRQRLCIARTIIKKADIYIFDDSFSALDFKTDAKVRKGLAERMRNAITIIVAQRISTVVDADYIMVLNNGKVSGIGPHDELSRKNMIYKEILESQTYQEVAV